MSDKHFRRVVIETSTLCPYAPQHNRCPAHHINAVRHLPASVVERLLVELGSRSYDGVLMLQGYNEPLAEPRLLAFLQMAHEQCPTAQPYIHSSGWGLDQVLLDELVSAGLKTMQISAYTEAEFYRLYQLQAGCSYNVHRVQELDQRLRLYDAPTAKSEDVCTEAQATLMIRASGNVVLCCRDWAETCVFGNVIQEDLASMAGLKQRTDIGQKLARGIALCDICKHCKVRGEAY